MFCLARPSEPQIRTILGQQAACQFSYPEVGASRGPMPNGYAQIHERACLGQGIPAFVRAVEALSQWKMFEMPWISLCWPDTPIQPGGVVAIVARHLGFWSLNFSRIVYVLDEGGDDASPVRRYGFAYGTLPEHAERGEELFVVEWDRWSDSVFYDLSSFSRPNGLLPRLGGSVARGLQRRFARESLAAMVRAVAS